MFTKIMDCIERYVTAILFGAMCTIIMLQIIFRATNISVAWTEELARYLFVWIIYLCGSRAMFRGKHLTVDILPIFMSDKGKVYINIISNVVSCIFFICLLYCGSLVLERMLATPQYSPANHVPMIVPYLAPTVGSLLMLLRGVQVVGKDIIDLKNGTYAREEGFIHE